MKKLIILAAMGLWTLNLQAQQEKELRAWYNDYNTAYFQGKLPLDTVIDKGVRKGRYAETYKVGPKFHITFSTPYMQGQRYISLTLLHEMCHIQEWDEAFNGKEHGPKWKGCMYKLKLAGAFDELLIEAN